jgi:hypothetical protein
MTHWNNSLWQQFGAAIDMFNNALCACPDSLWHASVWKLPADDRPEFSQFWYLAYHTLFWLDFYLSGTPEGFTPPAPFTMSELDPEGLPDRPYTKDELLAYLDHGRKKCQATIEALTDEKAGQPCGFKRGELSNAELLMYNMRHVQEHTAQLNLMLGQHGESASEWVSKAKRETVSC